MTEPDLETGEMPNLPAVVDKGGEMVHVEHTDPLTSAQSRINTVNTVMSVAMNRASTLVLTPEEAKALQTDFPDEAFKRGAAGKDFLIYIEHAYLRDRFTSVLGMGQWAILRTRPHWAVDVKGATQIYADCALLVRGCMVAEAIGNMTYYPTNTSQDYGDAAEGAVTAAFRRCAKNFGVGLQAWKKDFCDGWHSRNPKGGEHKPPVRVETKTETEVVDTRRSLDELLDLIGGYSLDKVASHFMKTKTGWIIKRELKAEWVKGFGEDGYAEIKARLTARASVLKPKDPPKPAPKPEPTPVEGLPTEDQTNDDLGLPPLLNEPPSYIAEGSGFAIGLKFARTVTECTTIYQQMRDRFKPDKRWDDYAMNLAKARQDEIRKAKSGEVT